MFLVFLLELYLYFNKKNLKTDVNVDLDCSNHAVYFAVQATQQCRVSTDGSFLGAIAAGTAARALQIKRYGTRKCSHIKRDLAPLEPIGIAGKRDTVV